MDMPAEPTRPVAPENAFDHRIEVLPVRERPVPLRLPVSDFHRLLTLQGPSLALWRGAEIAALREQRYAHPILDLGCGDGLVTAMVLRDVDYGIDPDVQALQRAAGHGIYRHLVPATAEEMPIPDGTIATVISNSVVEHLTRLDGALDGIVRVLAPGGRFIFTTPTDIFSEWLALPSPNYAVWRNRQLAHRTLLSAGDWAERLAAVGLQVEVVQPYLRREAVWVWDALELLQQVWIGNRRLVSVIWRHLPAAWLDSLAERYAGLDLSAADEGGGQLIVARKI
jgi:SAM-dependent methyltransferase